MLVKGSDFIGNYLFCPLRESLCATMATIPERQQTHEGKSEQGKLTLNLPFGVHEKAEEVTLLKQSPD